MKFCLHQLPVAISGHCGIRECFQMYLLGSRFRVRLCYDVNVEEVVLMSSIDVSGYRNN